jgi:prephenate dehydrogenase
MALVAAHPVAGKETTGAAAADPELFRGRRVIITPSARSTPASIGKIETLWGATGARVERMAPDVHDRILARSSHLPQIVASALAAALAQERVDGKLAAEFGAGGLRDTTRIAASSAEMWRDICLTNREAILAALDLYRASFEEFVGALKRADGPELEALFETGRRMREQLGTRERGK